MLLSPQTLGIIILVLVVWITGISYALYKVSSHYKRLVGKTGREDLRGILEVLLLAKAKNEEHVKQVQAALATLEKKSLQFVQKIGIVKFNPYSEAGGDHSFAIALLSGEGTGYVLLSLHSREGTRIYIKTIEGGKSRSQLSREEKQAVDQAMKSK